MLMDADGEKLDRDNLHQLSQLVNSTGWRWLPVSEVKEMKLVGFILYNKWTSTFEPMCNELWYS